MLLFQCSHAEKIAKYDVDVQQNDKIWVSLVFFGETTAAAPSSVILTLWRPWLDSKPKKNPKFSFKKSETAIKKKHLCWAWKSLRAKRTNVSWATFDNISWERDLKSAKWHWLCVCLTKSLRASIPIFIHFLMTTTWRQEVYEAWASIGAKLKTIF